MLESEMGKTILRPQKQMLSGSIDWRGWRDILARKLALEQARDLTADIRERISRLPAEYSRPILRAMEILTDNCAGHSVEDECSEIAEKYLALLAIETRPLTQVDLNQLKRLASMLVRSEAYEEPIQIIVPCSPAYENGHARVGRGEDKPNYLATRSCLLYLNQIGLNGQYTVLLIDKDIEVKTGNREETERQLEDNLAGLQTVLAGIPNLTVARLSGWIDNESWNTRLEEVIDQTMTPGTYLNRRGANLTRSQYLLHSRDGAILSNPRTKEEVARTLSTYAVLGELIKKRSPLSVIIDNQTMQYQGQQTEYQSLLTKNDPLPVIRIGTRMSYSSQIGEYIAGGY